MSKETLNLSIQKHLKDRAKKLAHQRGISVSELFEKFIAAQEDKEAFIPPPDSGTAQFINVIPESDKVADYDYMELKKKMLEERFGDE
jgi:antitoxin component of RelBE/YafQ-DinJ toxin-antitoxin module